jgi:hypothetical protein
VPLKFVETHFPDIPHGTGSSYLDFLRPYTLNQISSMPYGDFLSQEITFDNELESFLKVSSDNNHTNIVILQDHSTNENSFTLIGELRSIMMYLLVLLILFCAPSGKS